ncbi:MAG: UDP-N-acetylmuramoyl-tripeptide--D-alanyl-D-alanine ligase [Coraliomargarita sp.]
MAQFDPQQLAEWTRGEWLDGRVPETVNGFSFDARQLEVGQCFIALSGGSRDGHEFVAQAAENGALAALVEKPLNLDLPQLVVADTLLAMEAIATAHRSNFNNPVIGITGSCGKTSTKEMLRRVMGGKQAHATAGNWNNRIGVPMTLFELNAAKHSAAVVEAGINQPGEMSHLGAMIAADCVILTNIGPAHLELLKTLENVAAEKVQLLLQAKSNAFIIMPNSAYQMPALAACADRAIVLAKVNEAVSPEPKRIVRYRLNGSQLQLGDQTYRIESSSSGICLNAALAIVAGDVLGRTADQLAAIEDWQPDAKRGRIASKGGQTFYVDCYNANPTSMVDAFKAFVDSVPIGLPRCYVLGAMNELGADELRLHREVAETIKLRQRDRVCLVGPEHLTAAYREGLTAKAEQITMVDSADKIDSVIAPFTGAIFLKGSRSYALEKLLPEPLRTS